MGLFTSTEFKDLEELFYDQLEDVYDAEQRLTKALPQMADKASDPELKKAFQDHLKETEGQIRRLEQVFKVFGRDAKGKTCEAMKGLVKEGEEVITAKGDAHVLDAALICAAQRVEHYEIAAYGCLRNLAQRLGQSQAAELLQQTLDEEGDADKLLSNLAESFINREAARA